MSALGESKHADLLRSLGFERRDFPESLGVAQVDFQTHQKRSVSIATTYRGKHERAVVQPEIRLPCFMIFDGMTKSTRVIDETGAGWEVCGKAIDLNHKGFNRVFETCDS